MCATLRSDSLVPREGFVPVKNAELYYRNIGEGQPIIIIHGGPDFDHTYLLPDMDRLCDTYRLVYYDQRGRGRSRGALRLEEINIDQTVEVTSVIYSSF